MDKSDAFALVAGNTGSFGEVHDSGCGKSMGVEEAGSSEGDGRMARGSESLADGVAKKVALGVDGMKRNGDARIESIEDGTGRDVEYMRLDGG